MKPVHAHEFLDSTAISLIEWRKDRVLAVAFHSGKTYHFAGVPEALYHDFAKTESAGRFFAQHVKGKYQQLVD